jgi:hypothetical protein
MLTATIPAPILHLLIIATIYMRQHLQRYKGTGVANCACNKTKHIGA